MSSEEYGTESFKTTESSEYAMQHSMSDEFMEGMDFPVSEIEKEIEEEHYEEFKPQLEILVQLGKKKLRPLELTDCYATDRPGMFLDILPKIIFETIDTDAGIEDVEFPKPIFRQTIDQGTIASVEYKSSSAQTLKCKLVNSWCQYEPRLFAEEESFAVSEEESFRAFLNSAEERILDSLIQNETADCFFRELESLTPKDTDLERSPELTLEIQASFHCFENDEKQIIGSISWHSVQKDLFIASTLCNIQFEKRIGNLLESPCDTFVSFVWSCKNPFMPKIRLEHFEDITIHKFNPTLPNIVAGGTPNGLLVIWNLDQADILIEASMSYEEELLKPVKLPPSVSSVLEHSHNRAIADLVWIPSHFEVLTRGHVKANTTGESFQIATYGLDGILKFWDLRTPSKSGISMAKMLRLLTGKWEPFHSVEIVSKEKRYLTVTRFALKEASHISKNRENPDEEISKRKFSTEFYAGCDDGSVFCGNFKISRDDAGNFSPVPPQFFNSPHSGAITALVASPFISGVFLSTGSRTVAVWNQEIKESPIYSKDMHTNITTAEWSITRPALFILGYEDGSVEMWDLHYSIYEPCLIHYVSTAFITALSMQDISDNEYLLSVGDSDGIAFTLSLPPYLWKPLENEQSFMEEFVEKTSNSTRKTLQGIQKLREDVKIPEKEEKESSATEEIITDDVLQSNYQEFLEMQKQQLKYLGIVTEDPVENR